MSMALRHRPSPNHDVRAPGVPIDLLVLHYTGMESAQAALDRLADPGAKVGAHYLVDEDGTVTALVDEGRRAWHAGLSCWRGEADVNSRSIGIELVNPGHEYGYRPFPEPQMRSLERLAAGILARHPIAARNVVGHSDVAPSRKCDPGELFDWCRLAAAGIGLWPNAALPTAADEGAFRRGLADYGYDTADPVTATVAFQRHFRPACCDGRLDEETAGRLRALLDLIA